MAYFWMSYYDRLVCAFTSRGHLEESNVAMVSVSGGSLMATKTDTLMSVIVESRPMVLQPEGLFLQNVTVIASSDGEMGGHYTTRDIPPAPYDPLNVPTSMVALTKNDETVCDEAISFIEQLLDTPTFQGLQFL